MADESEDRTTYLRRESEALCKALGLRENILTEAFQEESDWAFIIKIDALLEMACRELIRKFLRLEVQGEFLKNEKLDDFIDSLSIVGRTSVLSLLEASSIPIDHRNFIRDVRTIRNRYAHDIRVIDASLVDTILARKDKTSLLKNLSAISEAGYKEAEFIELITKDPGLLRFTILDETMRFLAVVHLIFYKKDDTIKSP
jgi:hypothetical protein